MSDNKYSRLCELMESSLQLLNSAICSHVQYIKNESDRVLIKLSLQKQAEAGFDPWTVVQ